MRVVSYNTRGLRVGHSAGDTARRLVVDKLLEECDIMCVQETWLSKQDLEKLNTLHPMFHGVGESTTDLSERLAHGRIPGGVATLWNCKYDSVVTVLRLEVDWAIGIEIKLDNRSFIILNVYTPYESYQNEHEYNNRLAFINAFITDNDTSCVYVVGDMNADISDDKSLFGRCLMQFCDDNNLILSSKSMLPDKSFTYISEAWHTVSWLDHCICSADAHASLDNIVIHYELATTDHIPING